MGLMTTSKSGVLTTTEGDINLTLEYGQVVLTPGDTIPAGATLSYEDGLNFVITFDDGTVFSDSTETTTIDETPESQDPFEDLAALEEIAQLQALIESGEDPTAELPETAAGEAAASNQGGSGFSSLDRNAAETIAQAGFDTQGFVSAPTLTEQEQYSFETDIPTVPQNDSNIIAEDEVATGNVLANDTDVDTELSVISFEVEGQSYVA
ncbi:retention module-containing protein, partial [Shewanella maritima]|uniref:retention module-containing protein n=1 Tax=Shewanella maritima TaxID=2520507 RepID=UPI003736E836